MRKFIPLFENFENHLSSDNWEYVKTDTLWQYKEFDRSVDVKNSDSLNNIKRLEKILSEEGFNQPLILQYSKKYQTAYLTEGNHRLVAAKNIGIEYIPVRVTTDGGDKKDAKRVYRSVDNPTLPSQIGIESYDKDYNLIYIDDEVLDINDILSSFPDIIEFKETSTGVYDISVKLKYDSDILGLFDSSVSERIEACDSYNPNVEDVWKKIQLNNFKSTYSNNTDIDDEFFADYRKNEYVRYLNGGFETPFGGNIEWLTVDDTGYRSIDVKGINIKNEHIKDYKLLEGFHTFLECMVYNYKKSLVL